MLYFVTYKGKYGVLENARIGGFKHKDAAIAMFRRFSTSQIQVYTANGLMSIAVRRNGQETNMGLF